MQRRRSIYKNTTHRDTIITAINHGVLISARGLSTLFGAAVRVENSPVEYAGAGGGRANTLDVPRTSRRRSRISERRFSPRTKNDPVMSQSDKHEYHCRYNQSRRGSVRNTNPYNHIIVICIVNANVENSPASRPYPAAASKISIAVTARTCDERNAVVVAAAAAAVPGVRRIATMAPARA